LPQKSDDDAEAQPLHTETMPAMFDLENRVRNSGPEHGLFTW
jgi:hypothetical protein